MMDKNTLLAVVLSVIVITIGFSVQSTFFPPEQPRPQQDQTAVVPAESAEEETAPETAVTGVRQVANIKRVDSATVNEETVLIETNIFQATFSNRGGVLTSLKLKEHEDNGKPLEMIYTGESNETAFNLHFGGPDREAVDDLLRVVRLDGSSVRFEGDFTYWDDNGNSVPFTLQKTYTFKPDDYLFELDISIINSINDIPRLENDGFAYTLSYGPQIGPEFSSLGGRQEYRRFYQYDGSKRHTVKIDKDTQYSTTNERYVWAAIAGKYFTVIAVPGAASYSTTYSSRPIPGLEDTAKIHFSRPVIKSSRNTDTFRFYFGPKTARILDKYNEAEKNGFNMQDLDLDEVIDQGRILGWLENILKFILLTFYKVIPNYGVAIILLTIFIKIVLFPFTHKSYESTSKMQSIGPKINELREKYKDNPNKMNAEMAAMYKREGINPMGGCLPILFQMPIFIALYGLLNKHFDLRGAVFIEGWITDLSSPETIFTLPFTIPILGWSEIHLLPFLFVGTQLWSSKQMSAGSMASNNQMKMMTYLMPIMFFFILYDMPSGLLLYWTVTNLLTTVQQLFITRHQKTHPKGA
ncbi:membrane protein insertase YidC [Marispirochaeta aestuarii]|uniref:membrane protein insertase YidC n=1 Tax=Marispirochaeta aestuarii TaxID=1963862 RepID=UPI0029C8558A|nr:membrane protein insertase YidC [Marispirochaeta aestuarii]